MSALAAEAEQRPGSNSSSVSLRSHGGVHDDLAALNFPSFEAPSPWRICATQSGCDTSAIYTRCELAISTSNSPAPIAVQTTALVLNRPVVALVSLIVAPDGDRTDRARESCGRAAKVSPPSLASGLAGRATPS